MLNFTTESVNDNCRVVALSGSLNLETVPDLRPVIEKTIKKERADIVLDMSEIDYLDSSGIGFLVVALRLAKKKKRRFVENELGKIPGVKFNKKNVRQELLQGMISLGDQTIASDLLTIACSNHISKSLIKPISSGKKYDDVLPWDFIEYPINKKRLWRECHIVKSHEI